jgi:hypothetical protein
MFMNSSEYFVKRAKLKKEICGFNEIPMKIPMTFLTDIEKTIQNFI